MPPKINSIQLLSGVRVPGTKSDQVWVQALVILALTHVRNELIERGELVATAQADKFRGDTIESEYFAQMLYGRVDAKSLENARKAVARIGENTMVNPVRSQGYWEVEWVGFSIDAAAPGAAGALLKDYRVNWTSELWVKELVAHFEAPAVQKGAPRPLRAEDFGIDVEAVPSELRARLEACLASGGKELDLSGLFLGSLPEWMANFSNLTSLSVSDNILGSLPDWMANFTDLTFLDVGRNALGSLPDWMANFTNLASLSVWGNGLGRLPDWMANFSNLTSLDVSSNNLWFLPDWIASLINLTRLSVWGNNLGRLPDWMADCTNLTSLNVHGNNLGSLPEWMANFTKLTELHLGGNNLGSLPEWMANFTNLTSLDLSDNNLRSFPDGISHCTNLTSLDLSGNNLRSLPDWMANFTKLTSLDLSGNNLRSFPDGISHCTNLTSLDLSGNNLRSLPDWMADCTNLTSLNLSGNSLPALPDWMANFTKLTELHLGGNNLGSLPEWMADCTNLTSLNVSYNSLPALPEWMANFTNLTWLDVSNNNLGSLPDWMANFTNLTWLDVSNNNLGSLPDWMANFTNLDSLDVSYNHVSTLPPKLAGLPSLKYLFVSRNPLGIAEEALDSTNPKVIFEALFSRRRPLNSVKITLVGQANAGKTSVSHYLRKNAPHPDAQKTVGIQIDTWKLECPERSVDALVWDFGGQEMMHATHQVFLRDRSLFLYVFHSRDDVASNRLHYWMETIRTVAPTAPIIVVCNHTDQHQAALNEEEILEQYGPSVFFVHTSAQDGTGFGELREQVTSLVAGMEMVTQELPVSWITVRDAISGDQRDTISYDDYVKVCNEKGVNPETEEGLLDILDRLGVALRYDNNGTFVLKPEWITTAIYKIICARSDQHEDAKVPVANLADILGDNKRYPKQKHDFIIDMMDKFDLCHKLPQRNPKHLFVPSLATAKEPNRSDWKGLTRLVFHYKALRPGILHRVIVRGYEHLDGPSYWQTGADFSFENAKVRLRQPGGTEWLELLAKGDDELAIVHALGKVRDLVRGANAEYENLNVREFVVADGSRPDTGAYYEDLCNWEEGMATETYVSGMANLVNIAELLNRVSFPHERRGKRRDGDFAGY